MWRLCWGPSSSLGVAPAGLLPLLRALPLCAADGLRAVRCLRLCLRPGPGLPALHPPLRGCAAHGEEDGDGGVFPGGTRQRACGGVHFTSGCPDVRPVSPASMRWGRWKGRWGAVSAFLGRTVAVGSCSNIEEAFPDPDSWPLSRGGTPCQDSGGLYWAPTQCRALSCFSLRILSARVSVPLCGALLRVVSLDLQNNPVRPARLGGTPG